MIKIHEWRFTLKKIKAEVWNRVCGYFRPVDNWNIAKQKEFKDRKTFKIKEEDEKKEVCD